MFFTWVRFSKEICGKFEPDFLCAINMFYLLNYRYFRLQKAIQKSFCILLDQTEFCSVGSGQPLNNAIKLSC